MTAETSNARGEWLPDRDESKAATEQGLFRKFEVRRTDGSDAPGGKHDGCEYFVLDMTHDPHAKAAAAAYAASVAETHPQLAADMGVRYGITPPPAAEAQPGYSIDADPAGIRARVADAITGALAFGAQGSHPPPSGHWLEPFWNMARAEAQAQGGGEVVEKPCKSCGALVFVWANHDDTRCLDCTAPPSAPVGEHGPNWRYATVSAIGYIDAGEHDQARDMLQSALTLSAEASSPSAPVGVEDGINVPAAKALIEALAPGFKVIYRSAFRWLDQGGNVLPNHYEMFSAETLARDFGYDLVLDLGYAAILRDPSALAQQPAAAMHAGYCEGHCPRCDAALATQHQEPKS